MDLLHEEFSHSIVPMTSYPSAQTEVEVSGGQKARATLLCSGVFLGMVGMTFTVMGWLNYERSGIFEWTQLLGPILLFVGASFVVIGFCKVKKLNCKFWEVNDEQPTEGEQMTPPQPFVFTGIGQPYAFRGATVVQYVPPPYAIPAHNCSSANNIPPGSLPITTCPPQYYTIYPVDNPVFSGDESTSQVWGDNSFSRECDYAERADGKTAVETPPAYEDIFPQCSPDSVTS